MGLLDEAIREHLELKRRRGADPGEVARLEHEALGPIVNGAHEPEEPELALPESSAAPHPPEATAEHLQAPAPEVDQPTQLIEVADLPPAEPAPAVEPALEQPGGAAAQEAARQDVPAADAAREDELHEDELVPADEEPREEDVLEETPDFLQETPEHDRLWFEQKPPRDFDF